MRAALSLWSFFSTLLPWERRTTPMLQAKRGFVAGFVAASVLSGAVVVYSAGEIYTPKSSGNWIRDALVYNPTSADQVNVLGDIAPGTAVQMLEVGQRLNAMNGAAKKKNWAYASYQLDEMVSALEKLKVTRPSRAVAIQAFLDANVPGLEAAIVSADKATYQAALETTVAACTQCHEDSGFGFLTVKVGKSTSPIE